MSMFGPQDHAANGPETWQLVRSGRTWSVLSKDGYQIALGLRNRKEAEAIKADSRWTRLYEKEGRWYAGEHIPGWRDFATR